MKGLIFQGIDSLCPLGYLKVRKEVGMLFFDIVEEIKKKIIQNDYKKGQVLPSVLDLSKEFQVNQNTILRALQILTRDKILIRKDKQYLIQEDSSILFSLKNSFLEKEVDQFFMDMKELGYSDRELIQAVLKRGGIDDKPRG